MRLCFYAFCSVLVVRMQEVLKDRKCVFYLVTLLYSISWNAYLLNISISIHLSVSPLLVSLFYFWLFPALQPILRCLFLTGCDKKEVTIHLQYWYFSSFNYCLLSRDLSKTEEYCSYVLLHYKENKIPWSFKVFWHELVSNISGLMLLVSYPQISIFPRSVGHWRRELTRLTSEQELAFVVVTVRICGNGLSDQ